jgi:hypothetical protein
MKVIAISGGEDDLCLDLFPMERRNKKAPACAGAFSLVAARS